MSEATVRSQVRYSEKTDLDAPAPLVLLDDVKDYFGVTDPVLDAPLTIAIEVVSSVIRSYTGRTLTLGQYREVFTDVFEPKIERYLIETPVENYLTGNAGALLNKQTGRVALTGGATIAVEYEGGYTDLPADLKAVFMELTRQQMSFMGFASIGTARSADTPQEKAITLGTLKVEYAVNATTVGAQATGMGALSEQALAPYAPILDKYLSYRRLVAT